MLPGSDPRGGARWVALGALVALVAGLALAAQQWRRPAAPSEPRSGPRDPDAAVVDPADDVDDVAIEQALRLTPGLDGARDKSGWMDEVKGVEPAALGAERRELFLRHANAQRCTCGCGYTLARCRTYDPSCEVSLPRVRALFDSVRIGAIGSAVGLRSRPGSNLAIEPRRR
jgi:hypothetical protein